MRATALACCLLLTVAASAQEMAPAGPPDPVEVRNLTAAYELTNADGSLRCAVTLDPKPAGRGLTLQYDREACRLRFGFIGEVTGWLPGIAGAILMIAGDGRIVTEFTEGVGGVYEAIRENDGVYFFANQQFVDPASRIQPADLLGEWILAHVVGPKDKPRTCTLAFTDQVAGDQLFRLNVNAECDPAIAQTKLNSWQLERGDIVLHAANGTALRFEKEDDGSWTKVPEKPQPMRLSRP